MTPKMKIGCDWKRDSDKSRRFSMEFEDELDFKNFLVAFLKQDVCGEVLNLRVWKETRGCKR